MNPHLLLVVVVVGYAVFGALFLWSMHWNERRVAKLNEKILVDYYDAIKKAEATGGRPPCPPLLWRCW